MPAPPKGQAVPRESDTPAERLEARVASQSRRSSWDPTRKDRGLGLPRASASTHHPRKEIRHLVQSSAASNILRAFEPAIGHQAKRPPAGCRCVMKTRLQGNVAVWQTVRVQLDLRSAGWPTEEIDRAPFSHHVDCPFPRSGTR